MLFAPVEEKMWEKSSSKRQKKMSDGEINDKYSSQENRILTEINREKLPSFAEALKKKGYMNVQPVYQRRPRWDAKMKSRLLSHS